MSFRRNAVYIVMVGIIVVMAVSAVIAGDGQKAMLLGVLMLAIFGVAKKDYQIVALREWEQVQREWIEQQDQVIREYQERVESAGGANG